MIERGVCNFLNKTIKAQSANVASVIIANSHGLLDDSEIQAMACPTEFTGVCENIAVSPFAQPQPMERKWPLSVSLSRAGVEVRSWSLPIRQTLIFTAIFPGTDCHDFEARCVDPRQHDKRKGHRGARALLRTRASFV